jgi:uncharacterized protein YecE (DUF72 family)
MRSDRPSLFIGTSGFYYPDWRGCFYPAKLPAREYLPFYSTRFKSLEVNSTFYRLPLETTLSRWRDITPPGFVFAVKASRFITHIKRLDDPEHTVAPFLDRIRCLGSKLGPVLFQLPSRFPFNGEKLDAFCKVISGDFRYVFEFRDTDWFRQETCDILSHHNMAFCIYDFSGIQSPATVTADFVYLRFHGPLKDPYRGAYPDGFLDEWTEKVRCWIKAVKAIYVYFDNTMEGHAAVDAMKMQLLLAQGENHKASHEGIKQ